MKTLKTTNFQINLTLLFIVCTFALFSCNLKKDTDPLDIKEDTGIHKTFERGPVAVKLDTDKKEITIADRLNLTIRVISDENYEVELPGFGEKLEQFGIVDYHTSPPELIEGNKISISRSYVLEPFLSGDYTIPPMKVTFWEKGEKETKLHEIETEEIIITVTSLLPGKMEEMKLHDIRPPVNLPRTYSMWIWIGTIAGILIAGGVIAFIIIRKRRQTANGDIQLKFPAHELAFDELDKLISENLVEKGDVKLFYQRISDILRLYIENRFSIKAPEQTTEEFLSGLDTRKRFPGTYNQLLKNFLTHCDLVKFAELQPANDDIKITFDSCRDFIVETQEKE